MSVKLCLPLLAVYIYDHLPVSNFAYHQMGTIVKALVVVVALLFGENGEGQAA